MKEKSTSVFMALVKQSEFLAKENSILNQKLSIALDGLEVIISMNDSSANVVKRIKEAIADCDKELPQDISRIKGNETD
jgi:hypothetical protein|tara:strand:- start:219 stop:455 length:237 start_codon:yes stop_codon:yes gene_type:complete